MIGERIKLSNEQIMCVINTFVKYSANLEEEVKRLNKENEQLKKELDSFNPVVFQDVRKGTVILYSKGDIDE